MLPFYFKNAWRTLCRNKFFSFIHIFGLGISIACCLFIYFYIRFHLSYDSYHKDADNIYRVVYDLHLEKTEHDSGASYAMYQALKSDVAGVEEAAFAMVRQDLTLSIDGEHFTINKKAAFTSPEWFKLFDYHWLQGNPKALDRPQTVALMASTAKRLFGRTDVLGQTIAVDSKYPLKVVGIIDDNPSNTSLKSDLYISAASLKTVMPGILDNFFTDWGYTNTTNQLYVRTQDPSTTTSIEKTLNQLTQQYFGEETGKLFKYQLQALSDVHFNPLYGGSVQKSLLSVLAIISLSILLIATLNYVNLSLVQYAKRSTEIGTRKVLGGSRTQLFLQFITASTCIAGLGSLLAIGLLQIMLPAANQFLFVNEPLAKPTWQELFYLSLVIWIAISLLSGIYPAYTLGRLSIIHSLKHQIKLGTGGGRKVMIAIQNVISLCLIIGTIVIVNQVRFLRSTDWGFDRESVLLVSLPKDAMVKEDALRTFLNDKTAIENYSFCFKAPAVHDSRGGTFLFDQRADWESWPARATFADSTYLPTMGIQLLAGHNIRENKALPEYLINVRMARQLGYKEPQQVLGKSLLGGGMHDEQPGVIVGVVADYNTKSLHEAIEPTVIGYDRNLFQTLAIKVNPHGWTSLVKQLAQEWTKLFPNEIFHYQFLDEQIDQLYTKEVIQEKLIWTAASLAIFISSLGILGLISLTVLQRTKEIGIRKVLGATVTGIFTLLSKDFVKLVLISLMLASPIAWWTMNKWLENFAYKIEIQWWVFAVAGLTAIAIALLTVSFQAAKAALTNPVNSLRDE